jgi:hypothetical protein
MGKRSAEAKAGRRKWKWWTEREARKQVKAWRASGESMSTFARKRGFSSSRLKWWLKRIGEWSSPTRSGSSPDVSRLVEARVVAGAVHEGVEAWKADAARVIVHAPGGVRVEVVDTKAVPAEWVAAMVKELQRVSP